MLSSSWSPDEKPDIINDEVAWLQGAFLSSLLCGAQITLSAISFLAVLKQGLPRRLRIILLVYVFFLCAIMTAGQQTNLLFVQMGFIQARNYTGGPNGFISYQYTEPVYLASASLFIIANLMMESLLVWRCKVVCCTGDKPIWVGVVIPCSLLVGEYVTSTLFIRDMLQGGYAINYAVVYSALSLVLNITVTIIIVGRLLLHRRRVVNHFGPGHGTYYASVATVLVESASLYTIFVILVIISFCITSSMSNMLQQMVAQVESIASLLIIYRIAKGKGWNDNVVVSTLDWQGDTEAQVGSEIALETPESLTQVTVAPAPSTLSKEHEAPTSTNESSAHANDVVA